MNEDAESGRSGTSGLAQIRDESLVEQKSKAAVLVDLLIGRWLTLLALFALAVTAYLLYLTDGTFFSIDVVVFAALSLALTVYLVITLVMDLRFE